MKFLHLLLKINTYLGVALLIAVALMALGGPGGGLIIFIYLFIPLIVLLSLSVFAATCLFLGSLASEGEMIATWKGVLLCLAALALFVFDVWLGGPIINRWLQ